MIKRSLVAFLLVYVGNSLLLSKGSLVGLLVLILMHFLMLVGRLFLMVNLDGHLNSLHRFLMDMNWLFLGLFHGGLLFRLAGADLLMDDLGLLRGLLDNCFSLLGDNRLWDCLLSGWLLSNRLNLGFDFGNGLRNGFYLYLNWLNRDRLHDFDHSWLFPLDLHILGLDDRHFFFLLDLRLLLRSAHQLVHHHLLQVELFFLFLLGLGDDCWLLGLYWSDRRGDADRLGPCNRGRSRDGCRLALVLLLRNGVLHESEDLDSIIRIEIIRDF